MGHYQRIDSTVIMRSIVWISFYFTLMSVANVNSQKQPNIVIIMADDMGFNDVSMHGSEIPTPNIDALGMHGIILNRFYSQVMCTPSRSALMTGKYPIHLGMQHFVIDQDQPWGLGLDEKLLPEYFREAGYSTNLIGKWHLGFYKRDYAPNARGFDTFFGYLGPYIDYWDHTFIKLNRNYSRGIDLRDNWEPKWGTNGTYATHMFTDAAKALIAGHDTSKPLFLLLNHVAPHAGNEDDPMQAPQEVIDRFSYIKNEQRRICAAMISVLDDGVGEIVQALDRKGILNETIIVFYSDNGAPTIGLHSNRGSNFPFRGQKNTPWEGAMRVPAAIWSPDLIKNRVSNDWMHVSDLLPTLAAAANVSLDDKYTELDGINQWDALTSGQVGPRKSIIHNIDPIINYEMYVEDGWKLVSGTTLNGTYDGYLGDFVEPQARINHTYYYELVSTSLTNQVLSKYGKALDAVTVDNLQKLAHVICQNRLPNVTDCDPLLGFCLYNLNEDPCENNNLADLYPETVQRLRARLDYYRATAVEPRNQPADPMSDPGLYNNTWTYWQDEVPVIPAPESVMNKLFTTVLIGSAFIIVLIVMIGCFVKLQRGNHAKYGS